ncbi:MAG: DUF4365 domain-containing protein [Desulfotomaculum sp.]|nr:DUF4365 domain-containing protein [Desulfotomaculum sp.]
MTTKNKKFVNNSLLEDNKSATLLAKKVFLAALPETWRLKRKKSEYGIDYEILLIKNENPTGLSFKTHIRGTRIIKSGKSSITYTLETKKLKYYCTVKEPVFLIVVDIVNNETFWLFMQEYIKDLEEKKPHWRQQKTVTIKIPRHNSLDKSLKEFINTIIKGQQFVHFIQFHFIYNNIFHKIKNIVNNIEGTENIVDLRQQSFINCSQEFCSSEKNTYDQEIVNSLKISEQFSIKKPEENREAYRHICDALEHAGYKASPSIRYVALGEKYYHDYMYYLITSYEIKCSSYQHKNNQYNLFNAIEELEETISASLDAGELTAASTIILRLADIYFNTFPYISSSLGSRAFSLLDSAHSLLELADNMIANIEAPERIIQ